MEDKARLTLCFAVRVSSPLRMYGVIFLIRRTKTSIGVPHVLAFSVEIKTISRFHDGEKNH